VVAAYLAQDKTAFWVVGGLAGLGLGAVQSASRAMMGRLAPRGREAEMFGFMALCGRSGSILGPVLFGLVASETESQRVAVLSVVAFYVLGLLLLARVRSPAVEGAAAAGDAA
jgi:UMF1 family MFS transporter